MVSTLFCERGNDFSYAKTFMPDMTPTTYKNKLVSIIGSVVKELFALIKKQCKTKVTELTENQLFTIKSALIKAHQWMGVKSTSALSTFFNFITKINVNRHKLITKEYAIQLYNVIATHVNDTSLDLFFLWPEDQFGNQIQQKVRTSQKQVRSVNSQSQVREIIADTFLQYFTLQKVSNFLLSKYGMDSRFEKDNIELFLRHIVQSSTNKINKFTAKSTIVCSQNLMEQIFQEQNKNILYALLQVYLRKTDDKFFYRQVMSQLQKLQNKIAHPHIHNHNELSQEQASNDSEPQKSLSESIRQDQFAEQQPKEMKMSSSVRYDTNCVFEEMFQVFLPKQGNLKSDRKSTTSSKRQKLAESVLYFDQ